MKTIELEGDALEFEREMLPHLPDVMRYARFLCREHGESDDLVQETYFRAFRARASYVPGTNARHWLFTICRNLFLRELARDSRIVPLSEDPEADAIASARLHVAAIQRGDDDVFARVDVGPAIASAIAQLPDSQRAVVAMVDIEGLSYEETASALRIPVGTVRSRLFRARRVLQELLMEHARDSGLRAMTSVPATQVAIEGDA